jgi:uncharacterized protein
VPFQFEWDPAKAIANFAKHGVTFWEATEAFYDPLSLTTDDEAHSSEERRYSTIGLSRAGRLLLVSHADRDDRIRIIGARRATRASNKTMKKTRPSPKRKVQAEPMPEVDFSNGVRGKYYRRLRQSVVTVHLDRSPASNERPPKPARSARAR